MSLDEIFMNQKPVGASAKDHTVSGTEGMVACAVKEAAEVGENVLKEGGNAMDAVIAMQLALTVVEGMNTSIGGGGYILYYDHQKDETKVFDGHSMAPSAVTPKLYIEENGEKMPFEERSVSPISIGVPGLLKMFELAYDTHGSMTMEDLVNPSIRLAEEGFHVNSLWERTLLNFKDRLGEEASKVFVPEGRSLREGDFLCQPDLAKSLRIIRDKGFSDLYEGEIANAIIETINEHGGIMKHADLEKYQSVMENPLWGKYKDYDLAFPPPPNGGGVALTQLLKIFEKLDVSQYDIHSWEKYHIVAEATRIALADQQTFIGDPSFIKIPYHGLFNDEYIEERMKLINFNEIKKEIGAGDPWKYEDEEANYRTKIDKSKHGMDTTHLTAVDQWGNIAACTTSIERIFGSGIMVPGYGFMLNNDLTDFNPEPGTANEPNANKFAVSSKSPTIAFYEGKPFLTIGSPGASTIVSSVAQVLLHLLDHKMDIGEAIDEVRIFNDPSRTMEWEDGINEEAMTRLKAMGYELDRSFKEETADDRISDVKAILIDRKNNKLYGSADSPRPGRTIGINKKTKK